MSYVEVVTCPSNMRTGIFCSYMALLCMSRRRLGLFPAHRLICRQLFSVSVSLFSPAKKLLPGFECVAGTAGCMLRAGLGLSSRSGAHLVQSALQEENGDRGIDGSFSLRARCGHHAYDRLCTQTFVAEVDGKSDAAFEHVAGQLTCGLTSATFDSMHVFGQSDQDAAHKVISAERLEGFAVLLPPAAQQTGQRHRNTPTRVGHSQSEPFSSRVDGEESLLARATAPELL